MEINSLISSLSSFALNVIDKFGYTGVFVLSLLESAAIPIPSEVVVPFSGFLAVSGRFNFWWVVAIATLANFIGATILFIIASKGGRWILEKYGKYIFIHKKDLDLGDKWFNKHGARAVFFGRLMPVVRTFISLPAGVCKMNFNKFTTYTLLGSLPWNLGLVLVGYKAGEHWDLLHDYFKKFDLIIMAVIISGIIWYALKHLRYKTNE